MPFCSTQAVFRGDADVLVDRLIEACQKHESFVTHGRELQPWCPDAGDSRMFEALEAPRGKHSRSPDFKKSSGTAAKRASPASPARRCSLDARQGYVCPSFGAAAAPKPSALPTPSSSLLTRAFRSPSPPKSMPIAA
ncbi:hypothetical protein MNEG_9164 [Monoraphidium neglectum]|uniref:Uncharacterized protein n=1 Tax=Monoraphidium neglectum TaxID=145388 RepID=A0A0D2KTK6_9CHLO|nr:hypothetical protein MNEG_9164 [Monoraphidium neglectum]KIY98798.1 hypothetical protein MNEG_9164 [Monoraphidium neglectum]|eukprot:XP_013897818.1 hypothetical protein MNEG_9164 [Monoraphidium neglectum]